MVVFLNVLLPLLIAVTLYTGYKTKKLPLALILSLVIGVGYSLIQPSYIPKGEVQRQSLPAFEHVDGEMKDVMRKAKPTEQYKAQAEAERIAVDERMNKLSNKE